MNLCLAVFLPDCMTRWWLHIIQLCRVVRDISEPRYPLLCPATSRATQHPPQWVTSIFMRILGFSAPPLTPQELWGNLDRFISHPAVAHSQVLPFRGALVQPRLSHHLLEKDNRKTHQLSPHNQQTYNFFFFLFPEGPILYPQHQQLCSSLLSLSSALQSALWQISCPWQTPNLPQRQGNFWFHSHSISPFDPELTLRTCQYFRIKMSL